MKKPHEEARSGKWPTFRKKFLVGKVCAVCGGTRKLEAHHIAPFHLHPALELCNANLIPLCEGNPDVNCHLVFGHLWNFKGYNPTVREDATHFSRKKKDNADRIRRGQG